ncbi:hypothetical protein OE88DRAFT_1655545 [Heliocybe sulcata]|uniref:TFIIS central domain-containing protein n=1 Tax=Heliocybe sulcata TaxID=5364 RepID=A0A5C3N7X1_9AGAM|nr:hypothetical protein OE88DRAFT_1655545 [Heliocybe sulcata]
MEWEGPDALEEVDDEALPVIQPRKRRTPARPREEEAEPQKEAPDKEASDVESDGGSSDDYVEESETRRLKSNAKRRPTRISVVSDSSGEEEELGRSHRRASTTSQTAGRSKRSSSPRPTSHLKRKQSSVTQSPAPKRKRSESSSAEDPARKYCLGKYEELFLTIFTRYPHLPSDAEGNNEGGVVEKGPQELSPDEKAVLESRAKQFASELEQCVYDTYAEPGQHGKQVAGPKYRERFRMLTFNLSKNDRVTLHKNIASSRIAPKDLSLMSSTDLANEELKQSIKLAEEEALQHSILQKTIAPRAKITHKGLQDIEDVHGENASQRLERERELEEEKRDRERLARLKQAQMMQRQASGSVPPESPITPQSASWGGPPPVPQHALLGDYGSTRPLPNPLFVPTPSEMMNTPVPNELNLADLINLDEETQTPTPTSEPPGTPFQTTPPLLGSDSKAAEQSEPQASPVHPTGISPFAAGVTPSDAPRPSFDLNALWSSPDKPKEQETQSPPTPPPEPQDGPKDIIMEASEGLGAYDEDFDMFLEKDDEQENGKSNVAGPPPQGQAIEKQSQVYTGALLMPLDTLIPQETPVVAYQMGGRSIASDSPLWRTLFPSAQLRIDGRVAVDKSSQFLLQMRMNATKELIAVAFTPAAGTEPLFRNLFDFLRNKNRHGLIFPWGNHPKEQSPGRELYIIPLTSAEPIPEYMELLDGLRLPKNRTSDYLIGIWVLNKGKLAPPPTPTHAPQAAITPQIPAVAQLPPHFQMPQLPVGGTPPNNVPRPTSVPAPAPAMAPVPAVPHNPSTAPAINPQAVAAELATLTPEQIQLMLQTLSGSGLVPPANAQTGIPLIPGQPPMSTTCPQPALWAPGAAGPSFAPGFPPNSPPRPPYSQPPHDRYSDREHEPRAGPSWDRDRNRDDRGWRGGNRGRGRGRGGRGRGRERDYDHRQGRSQGQDSGWGRRGRGGPP